ncbi:3-hydroxyacyl-CoA dehydrogenase [Aaosphaeria arxii CBS 175.79]|uniref:3-hydroxyacyl-CoA dehydrogenase n=1 Tax=Aaosphaeria arxii CBS 175.79 TaxID=1450172 RepID=A0A6A5XFI0_9PLEO|nr:3-hydroxyacyl-CoA dehydrogenase [Aaosphaeria arxii CBS 175.79]KAF2011606.1 3-hydroxyacyl-CoA dehydrogenase [Aaosphaeria arxii CBS 175.79]
MSFVQFSEDFAALRDQVVVLTGGARGIGASVVEVAAASGAHVVFGDRNEQLGQEVAEKTGATFVKADVTQYADVLKIFQVAFEKYGKIDHAVANAAVYEPDLDIFDPNLSIAQIEQAPPTLAFDINITGTLYFSRIAAVYLRQNNTAESKRSLTLVSSVAAFMTPPDTPVYNVTKAGIVSLARSLAQRCPSSHNIRVNCVCPSVTRTPLAATSAIQPLWEGAGLPTNEPVQVANVILGVGCDASSNRKVLWVEGGQSWDIEVKLLELLPQWIGDGPAKTLERVQELVKNLM